MRKITRIVVHCSATPPAMKVSVAMLKRWHTDPKPKGNGWKTGGYHWVITRDGEMHKYVSVEKVANGAYGFNAHSVHVCLIGGMSADRQRPEDNFTKKQKNKLRMELGFLRHRFPDAEIVGHRDLNPGKACPSFNVKAFSEEE